MQVYVRSDEQGPLVGEKKIVGGKDVELREVVNGDGVVGATVVLLEGLLVIKPAPVVVVR